VNIDNDPKLNPESLDHYQKAHENKEKRGVYIIRNVNIQDQRNSDETHKSDRKLQTPQAKNASHNRD